MNLSRNRNENGEIITLPQACQLSNLGSNTVRKLAEEAGAVRKIGRAYRINRRIFFDFIEKEYAE